MQAIDETMIHRYDDFMLQNDQRDFNTQASIEKMKEEAERNVAIAELTVLEMAFRGFRGCVGDGIGNR